MMSLSASHCLAWLTWLTWLAWADSPVSGSAQGVGGGEWPGVLCGSLVAVGVAVGGGGGVNRVGGGKSPPTCPLGASGVAVGGWVAVGVVVGSGVGVGSGVTVGAGVAVGTGVAVGAGVSVGGMGVAVGGGVTVGRGVAVGQHAGPSSPHAGPASATPVGTH